MASLTRMIRRVLHLLAELSPPGHIVAVLKIVRQPVNRDVVRETKGERSQGVRHSANAVLSQRETLSKARK